jgi:L-alanine-DL-glutamate epimerase-like enolase superfamily enzyme
MLIKEVTTLKITLPFAFEFSHSLRKRMSITNVFILIKGEDGRILGCGEGAPRSYVTGETPDTMIANISKLVQHKYFPWKIYDIEQIWNYFDSCPEQKEMNASICALEMALLDTFAREQNMKIIDFFSHKHYASPVIYSAAIPLGTVNIVKKACLTINNLGISRLKLKIGKDFDQNKSLLKTISGSISGKYDLKVDVNGVWDKDTAFRHTPLLSEYGIKVIEQPMAPGSGDISDFSQEAKKFNITLMADESACSFEDMQKISHDGSYGMVNVRVSKCGGLRRSIKVTDYLRARGIPFQIGCQLGESGLLSAAGRILSLLCGDSVSFEGSYDGLLLAENVTEENVSFGTGGIAFPLNGIGLGIDIDPVKIKKLSDFSSIQTFRMR